jgi:hypothetical protein
MSGFDSFQIKFSIWDVCSKDKYRLLKEKRSFHGIVIGRKLMLKI